MKLNNITYSFANQDTILKGVSICFSHNKLVSIVGKSGCGKSTLLNLMSGLLIPEVGTINIEGKTISYLTQKPTLLSYRNSLENALLGLELKRETERKSKEDIIELFSLFELNDALDKYPNELSGGMKQRVGIIQTILMDADLYLLDEPFTAIDRNTLIKIENFIWKLFRDKGATAIIVNHDLEQSILFSDRVVMLSSNPGTVVYDLSFSDEFIKLSPSERKLSPLYSDYLLDIVKKFSEL